MAAPGLRCGGEKKKRGVESNIKLTIGRAILCAEMTASTAAES